MSSIPLSLLLAGTVPGVGADAPFVNFVHTVWRSVSNNNGTTIHMSLPMLIGLSVFAMQPVGHALYCFAPQCGKLRLRSDEPLGHVLPKNENDPDDCGFVYDSDVQPLATGSGVSRVRYYLAAVCPRRGCWTAALHRLQAKITALPDVRLMHEDYCAHCYATLPATPVPCADGCGHEFYCNEAHRVEALPMHTATLDWRAAIQAQMRTCAACGQVKVALRKCKRCKKVYYCDVACQQSHWREHRQACS